MPRMNGVDATRAIRALAGPGSRTPIISLTADIEVARQLALVWGVHSVQTKEIRNFNEMVSKAVLVCHREGFAKVGDHIVIAAGVPFGCSGTTNILRVAEIEEVAET